jgi:hypothetical protein
VLTFEYLIALFVRVSAGFSASRLFASGRICRGLVSRFILPILLSNLFRLIKLILAHSSWSPKLVCFKIINLAFKQNN